ncbi:unnamed protein product, partial [Pylaiella littoralis]
FVANAYRSIFRSILPAFYKYYSCFITRKKQYISTQKSIAPSLPRSCYCPKYLLYLFAAAAHSRYCLRLAFSSLSAPPTLACKARAMCSTYLLRVADHDPHMKQLK